MTASEGMSQPVTRRRRSMSGLGAGPRRVGGRRGGLREVGMREGVEEGGKVARGKGEGGGRGGRPEASVRENEVEGCVGQKVGLAA